MKNFTPDPIVRCDFRPGTNEDAAAVGGEAISLMYERQTISPS
jgi:hypothetical protein